MSKSSKSTSRSSRSASRSSRTTTSTNTASRKSRVRSNAAPQSVDTSDDLDETDVVGFDTWDTFDAKGRATRKKADPIAVAAGAPWVRDGIDYGPARAAFKDLATWALDLAERAVADVATDRKRIRRVRRAILGGGSEPSTRDLMFTAQVLARVFDRDLSLGLADQLAILEELNLSTDVLPLWSPTPRAPTPLGERTPTRIPTPVPAEPPTATVRIRFETPSRRSAASVPPPLRFCDECGYVHEPGDHIRHYRNAA